MHSFFDLGAFPCKHQGHTTNSCGAGGYDVRTAALQLLLSPQVEFAEPNFLVTKEDLIPNDPQFHEQRSLRNTGQSGGQQGADINASGAWETTKGSSATVIAVIDSGIDFTHPDQKNNQWTNGDPSAVGDLHGWNFITDSGEIRDDQGHGTAVAGIIAAESNNSLGIPGVMWRASPSRKALSINESLAEAHTSLGFVTYRYHLKWAEAEEHFKKAIALNPNYATGHQWYASYLAASGRLDEAVVEAKTPHDLEPFSLTIYSDYIRSLYYAGRLDEARTESLKLMGTDPSFGRTLRARARA